MKRVHGVKFEWKLWQKAISDQAIELFTRAATQRAKIVKNVHKPTLGVNVINFELNGFNASIYTDL